MFDHPRLSSQLKDCFGIQDAAGLKRYLKLGDSAASGPEDTSAYGPALLRFLMDVNDSYRQLEDVNRSTCTLPPQQPWATPDSLEVGTALFDGADCLVECNQAFRRMYAALDASLVPGQPYAVFMRHLHGYLVERDATRTTEAQWLAEQEQQRDGLSLQTLRVDGHWRWMAQTRSKQGFRLCQHVEAPGLEQGIDSLAQFKRDTEAAQERQQANQARSGHAIRTLIDLVTGMTGLGLDTAQQPDQRECLQAIQSAAGSLLVHVNDLLCRPGVASAQGIDAALPFSLRRLVMDCVKPLAVQAHAKNLELQVRFDGGLADAWRGEAPPLRFILQGLVENGIRFTTEGHVSVEVRPLPADNGRSMLEFAVADTGPGMTPLQLAQIFDVFVEPGSVAKPAYAGPGLSLASCRRQAVRLGGTLRADSVPGRGSRFRLTLPLDAADGETWPPQEKANLGGMSALIVDERPLSRRWLQDMLAAWGIKATLLRSADEALSLLQASTQKPDFILVDRELSAVDTLFDLVCQRPELCRRTVVLCRTLQWEQEQVALEARGLTRLITKPVDGNQLLRLLLRIVGRSTLTMGEAGERMTPLNILLAEDHPMQQRVTARLLERMGHAVTVVSDGQMAVDASAAQTFDLILMDVQMPTLDGLDATRAIRERESRAGTEPDAAQLIVAMTAVAMPGYRQLCLQAGMDGYVSKPVDRALLVEEIRRVLARQHSQTEWRPTAVSPLAPQMDLEQLLQAKDDLPDLDRVLVDERWAGRTQAFVLGVGAWLEGLAQRLQALRLALEAKDASSAIGLLLPLVSQAAVVCASAIEFHCRMLVQRLREQDLAAANAMTAELPALVQRFERAYSAWHGTQAAEPATP